MKKQAVSSAVIVSLLLSGPPGCQSGNKISKSKSSDTQADAAAERNRLQQKLNRPSPWTTASDRYKTRVKLANADTKASPLRVPDYNEYAGLVAQRPQDKDAKVAYAKALVATSDRAGRLYTDPHATQAVAWMSEVIAKHNDGGDYYLLRARCQEITGRTDAQVTSDVAKAAKLSPGNPAVVVEQAKLALAQQNYSAADAYIQAVLKHSPNNAQAHYLSGTLATLQEKPTVASTEYASALRYQPDHVDALTAAALTDWSVGHANDFQAKVQRVRAVFPQHPIVYFGQGLQSLQAGNRYAAVSNLQQASAGDPENRVYSALLQRVRIEQADAMEHQPTQSAAAANSNSSSGGDAIAAGATILVGLAILAALSGSDTTPSHSSSSIGNDLAADQAQQTEENNELCNRLRDQLDQEAKDEAEQRQREQEALDRERAWEEQQQRQVEQEDAAKEGRF